MLAPQHTATDSLAYPKISTGQTPCAPRSKGLSSLPYGLLMASSDGLAFQTALLPQGRFSRSGGSTTTCTISGWLRCSQIGCFRPLPSLLATPIRSGSVVNNPAFIPTTLIFQIERGASREEAKRSPPHTLAAPPHNARSPPNEQSHNRGCSESGTPSTPREPHAQTSWRSTHRCQSH
jgi:hypothetical protein